MTDSRPLSEREVKRLKLEENPPMPSLLDFALKSTLEQVFDQDPDLVVRHLLSMPELKERLMDELLSEQHTDTTLMDSDLVEVERLRIEPSDDPMPHADEWDRSTMRVDQLPFRFRTALKKDYKFCAEEWMEKGFCCWDTWTEDGRIQWQLHPWDELETWEADYMKAVREAIKENDVPDHDYFHGDIDDVEAVVDITSCFPNVEENTVLFDAYDYALNDASQEIRSEFQKEVNNFLWGTAPNKLPNAYKEPVHQLAKYVAKPKVRLVITGCGMMKHWSDHVAEN